ncbi:MAG: tetratricopeptide repeat protein [Candidatus Eisenbacteria bacterium]
MNRIAHKTGWILIVLLAFGGVLGGPAPSRAQDGPGPDPRFQRRLEEASRHLRRGGAERARRIFEELLSERPEDRDAFAGLIAARIETFDLEGLGEMVETRIAEKGIDPELSLLLGDVHAAAGRRPEAMAVWRASVDLFDSREEAYRLIARRMEDRRMVDEAILFLREGRRESGDRFQFSEDLCRLLGFAGKMDESAREWVRAAAAGTRKNAEAARRLQELRNDGEIDAYPYDEMRAILDSLPSRHGVREILAECYLEDGRCDAARGEYEELERSQPRCGTYLMPFAKRAAELGCFGEAAKAASDLARRCDRPSVRLDAAFLLARVQREEGNPDGAIATYDGILKDTKNVRETNRARFELASVLVDEMGEGERAIPVLEELLRADKYDGLTDARFLLARGRLITGDFEGARTEYQSIHDTAEDDDTRERAIFAVGRSLFFAGDMDGALAEYRRVVDQYPAGFYLNDAIDQSIFISGHRDAGDGALREYADCLLRIDRKDFDGGRKKVESLLETLTVSHLRDELTWQLGRIAEEEGLYRQAVEVYERLVAEFPGERLAHVASVRVADLYCTRLGDIPRGLARYDKFLVDHPTSILADEARRKKREAQSEHGS